jgi:hypothetical protein
MCPRPRPRVADLVRSAVWDGKNWSEVKNLGWLLKNRKNVEQIEAAPSKARMTDAILIAYIRDGKVYATPYASRSVLAGWLARPVFMGVPLNWFGHMTEVRKGLE